MTIHIADIAEYCNEQMENTFQERLDIFEDKVVDRVQLIVEGKYEIDYIHGDKKACDVLVEIKKMNLSKKLTAEGDIKNISQEDASRAKQLIALYCMLSYNAVHEKVKKAVDDVIEDIS